MDYVEGIDVSAVQGPNFPWGLVASQMSEVSFAYLQATQRDWEDSCFVRNATEAKHIDVLTGSYHVLHPALSAKKQAQLFYNTAWGITDLPPALDLELHKGHEADPDQTPAMVRACAREWLDETKRLWKCERPLLYSYPDYFNHWLGATDEFEDCDLWWARYEAKEPNQPKAWSKATLWQYSDGKHVKTPWGAGIDRNRFMGSEEDFREWTGNPYV